MIGARRAVVVSCLIAGCSFGNLSGFSGGALGTNPDAGVNDGAIEATDTTEASDAGKETDSGTPGDAGTGDIPCDPSVITLGAAGGPGPCAYGEVCSTGSSKCTRVSSCAPWDPSAHGPVIVDARVLAQPHNETLCPTTDSGYYPKFGPWGTYFQITYYTAQGQGLTFSSYSDLNARIRVRTSADTTENPPWYHSGSYAGASGTTGTVNFGACSANMSTEATIYLVGNDGVTGNRVCITY